MNAPIKPADLVEKRKPLTRVQFAQLLLDQDGRCGCGCGEKLNATQGIIDEHVRPLGLLGSNALENRSLWRASCSKAKTKADKARIAKAKRQGGETGNSPKRPIRSPGFRKDLTRGFDRKVRPRRRPQHEEEQSGEQ